MGWYPCLDEVLQLKEPASGHLMHSKLPIQLIAPVRLRLLANKAVYLYVQALPDRMLISVT